MLLADSSRSESGRIRALTVAAIAAVMGMVVFAASVASIAVTREAGGVAAIWPADAIILAAVLLLPQRFGPMLLGAGFLGIFSANAALGVMTAVGVGLASCNIAGLTLAAATYRSFAEIDTERGFVRFSGARDLLGFAAICGAVGPIVSATLASGLLWVARGDPFGTVWLEWFLSDALGILAITPLLLSIGAADAQALPGKDRVREAILLLGASAGIAVMEISQDNLPILFLLFPAVILPAFRLGFAATALVCTVVSAIMIAGTLLGHGPLMLVGGTEVGDRVLWLQFFLLVMNLTALPVASALAARRVADDQLAQSRRDLQNIIDNMPAMIAYWDKDLNNRFCNQTYVEWFGKSPDQIMTGMHIRDVIGERLYALNRPYIEGALRGERQSFEREIPIPTGERRHTLANYIPNVRDGKVEGFYVLVSDITDLKRTEMALKTAKDAAERATRAKSVFLSHMSHELRTPMNSIIGFTELLQTGYPGPFNERQSEYLELVRFSAKHMLNLIDDILEFNQVEAGRLKVEVRPVAVAPLLQSVVSSLKPLAERRRVRIRDARLAEGLPMVMADPTRATEVLLNLGSNAIKYNHPGGYVEFSADAAAGGFIRFKVTDNGIGIAEDQQSGLFEEFNRLGAEHTGIEGTGIGLALTKRLVELMHGVIGFVSAPGQGSTFWFDLPAERGKSKPG